MNLKQAREQLVGKRVFFKYRAANGDELEFMVKVMGAQVRFGLLYLDVSPWKGTGQTSVKFTNVRVPGEDDDKPEEFPPIQVEMNEDNLPVVVNGSHRVLAVEALKESLKENPSFAGSYELAKQESEQERRRRELKEARGY